MNVPEMTIGGEKPVDTTAVLDNLRRENDELFARCNVYEDARPYRRSRVCDPVQRCLRKRGKEE